MQRYIVTYVQEATQPVQANTIADAGAYAQRYAADNKLRVLSVIAAEPAANLPTTAGA